MSPGVSKGQPRGARQSFNLARSPNRLLKATCLYVLGGLRPAVFSYPLSRVAFRQHELAVARLAMSMNASYDSGKDR